MKILDLIKAKKIHNNSFYSIEQLLLYNSLRIDLFNLINKYPIEQISKIKKWDIYTLKSLINLLVIFKYFKIKKSKIILTKKSRYFLKKDNCKLYLMVLARFDEAVRGIQNSFNYMCDPYRKKLKEDKKNLIGCSLMADILVKGLFNKIKKLRKKKIAVLDIGCGYGDYLLEFYKKNSFAYLIGIDNDKDVIKIAQQNILNKELNRSIKLEFKDIFNYQTKQKFDFIFMNSILHYFDSSKTLKLFNKTKELLKEKGVILIREQVINKKNKWNFILDFQFRGYKRFTPQKTEEELINLLNQSGFNNVKKCFILPHHSFCYFLVSK